MSDTLQPLNRRTEAAIVDLLSREHLMTVACNRADGFPQATTVGYINDGLRLYFMVSRASQKFGNLRHDPRASIAIRSRSGGSAVGLSMGGHVVEVTDEATAAGLSEQMATRFPGVHVYCPSGESTALLQFTPVVVSAVGVVEGRSDPTGFAVVPREPPPSRS
ncbi:hypothetical protein GCM10009116_13890 [Brevundimonas basaltis]|uniref:General stress protein 26 n=1 Tax=Brevundimonas basaltis TaxID=472166 RepID=A0A7W8MGL7_9CAUL|nr:pyridoxamine 5'-phosphate oxidase family protein [Brevundimonas basaltis]MBB5291297.1 general stress protein 26 [Brevundimonas basaltis]